MISAQEARELLDKEIEKSNGQWLVDIEERVMVAIKEGMNSIKVDHLFLYVGNNRVQTLRELGYKVEYQCERFEPIHSRFASTFEYWTVSW